MKKTTFIFITFLTIYFQTVGQTAKTSEKAGERSKVESFSLKTGSLIKKVFFDIGTAKGIEIKVLHLTDLLSNIKLSGIKLETSVTKSYGSTEKSCFLDFDEIDALLKSAKLLIESLKSSEDVYSEYLFTSRDGFQAGAFSDRKEGWSYFLKLERYDNDSYIFMNKSDFQKMMDLISQAKSKL